MEILIVAGFLGAGKTTFIKRLIENVDTEPCVLENEYGEVDLDGNELRKASEQQVFEFNEGCVCCTKKDVFANSLITISASVNPEYLVIEPTGVARLGSLINNVKKVEWENIKLLSPLVIIAPRTYYQNLQMYPEICENQIKNTNLIVLSKIENESRESIQQVVNHIKGINPDVEILDTPYQNMPKSWWMSLFGQKFDENKEVIESQGNVNINQYTIKGVKMKSMGQLITMLECALHGQFGNLVRMKGIVKVGEELIRFDMADSLYSIINETDPNAETQCVFIGDAIDFEKIKKAMGIKEKIKFQAKNYVNMFKKK